MFQKFAYKLFHDIVLKDFPEDIRDYYLPDIESITDIEMLAKIANMPIEKVNFAYDHFNEIRFE